MVPTTEATEKTRLKPSRTYSNQIVNAHHYLLVHHTQAKSVRSKKTPEIFHCRRAMLFGRPRLLIGRSSLPEKGKAALGVQLFRSGEHQNPYPFSAFTVLLHDYNFPSEMVHVLNFVPRQRNRPSEEAWKGAAKKRNWWDQTAWKL